MGNSIYKNSRPSDIPIHDMTRSEHEHRWMMHSDFIETQVRKGLKASRVQQSVICRDEDCDAKIEIEDRPVPTVKLTEDQFDEEYKPDNNEGEFYSYLSVHRLDPHYVWTIVESGDPANDNLYAIPGFQRVNVVGYVVCPKPWTDDVIEATYLDRAKHREEQD